MKKLILAVILVLGITALKGQQTCRDSALVLIQQDFKHMRENIYEAQSYHNAGLMLHVVGLWTQVVLYTGERQDYITKENYSKLALYSIGLNLLGFGFEFYSHKFVNRASIQMTPNSVKIKF